MYKIIKWSKCSDGRVKHSERGLPIFYTMDTATDYVNKMGYTRKKDDYTYYWQSNNYSYIEIKKVPREYAYKIAKDRVIYG